MAPSGSPDLPAGLSSPTSPTPLPTDSTSTGFREGYKAEGPVFVTVKEIHCCVDNTSNIIKKYQWGHLHLSTGLAHDDRFKWD